MRGLPIVPICQVSAWDGLLALLTTVCSDSWRGMEVKIRSWCCSLGTTGLVIGGGMMVLYLAWGGLLLAKVLDTHGGQFHKLQKVYQDLGLSSDLFLTAAAEEARFYAL